MKDAHHSPPCMYDTIETIHGSLIQHGKYNDRIYVIHLDTGAEDGLLVELEALARRQNYRKILAKIPTSSWETFQAAGFIKEAKIACFFSGETDCYFVGKFFSERNEPEENHTALRRIVSQTLPQRVDETDKDIRLPVEKCSAIDAEELALFYQQTFVSYPFPIFEPAYLEKMMRENVFYFCIRSSKKIIAAAAAESSRRHNYTEMTDFATAPDWRKQGLATSLLARMERELESDGMVTAFTIARAGSYGMNMVFKKRGYHYAGLLKDNTQISGRIESMTVWHKRLQGRRN